MASPKGQHPEDQPSVTLPPLLALPLEIKQQILSNFDDDTRDVENVLTLMVLRRTHKSLRQIVPNPWNRLSRGRKGRWIGYGQWLAAERKYRYLFPWECRCASYQGCPKCRSNDCPHPYFFSFPCYGCGLDKRDNFKNYQIAYFRDEPGGWSGPDNLWDLMGGEHARDRLCDKCWRTSLEGADD